MVQMSYKVMEEHIDLNTHNPTPLFPKGKKSTAIAPAAPLYGWSLPVHSTLLTCHGVAPALLFIVPTLLSLIRI